jgi:cyclopropane fatty-acyl-phospholipid synthase-like methyltransferase
MNDSSKVNVTILHHDTGKPQKIIIELVASGEINGSVLEIGCGTGENSLYIAGEGYPTLGIDSSKEAFLLAKQKSQVMLARRGICARFKQYIPQNLDLIDETFQVIIDNFTFQTIPNEEKGEYTGKMVQLLGVGGSILLFLSSAGVNPLLRSDTDIMRTIEQYFPQDFCIKYIREIFFETGPNEEFIKGWLCSISKGEIIHAKSIAE